MSQNKLYFDQVSREEDHCPFFTECKVVRCFDSKLYFSPRIDPMLSTCVFLNNVTEGRQSGIIGDVARRENQTSFFAMKSFDFCLRSQMHHAITRHILGTTCSMTIIIHSTTAKLQLSSMEELAFE